MAVSHTSLGGDFWATAKHLLAEVHCNEPIFPDDFMLNITYTMLFFNIHEAQPSHIIVFAKSNGLFITRHPGESRGPEHIEKTGFRLPPE